MPRATISLITPKTLAHLNEELFYSHLQNDPFEQHRGINKTPTQCHVLKEQHLPAAQALLLETPFSLM